MGREGGGPSVPQWGCGQSPDRVTWFVSPTCGVGAADRWETHRELSWVPCDSGDAMINVYPGSQQHAD